MILETINEFLGIFNMLILALCILFLAWYQIKINKTQAKLNELQTGAIAGIILDMEYMEKNNNGKNKKRKR